MGLERFLSCAWLYAVALLASAAIKMVVIASDNRMAPRRAVPNCDERAAIWGMGGRGEAVRPVVFQTRLRALIRSILNEEAAAL